MMSYPRAHGKNHQTFLFENFCTWLQRQGLQIRRTNLVNCRSPTWDDNMKEKLLSSLKYDTRSSVNGNWWCSVVGQKIKKDEEIGRLKVKWKRKVVNRRSWVQIAIYATAHHGYLKSYFITHRDLVMTMSRKYRLWND